MGMGGFGGWVGLVGYSWVGLGGLGEVGWGWLGWLTLFLLWTVFSQRRQRETFSPSESLLAEEEGVRGGGTLGGEWGPKFGRFTARDLFFS